MKLRWIVLMPMFAGCALTPAEVKETGEIYRFDSAQSPRLAADCIARNADNRSAGWHSTIRVLAGTDSFEVIIRGGGSKTIAVAAISPGPAATHGQLHIVPALLGTNASVVADLMAGC